MTVLRRGRRKFPVSIEEFVQRFEAGPAKLAILPLVSGR